MPPGRPQALLAALLVGQGGRRVQFYRPGQVGDRVVEPLPVQARRPADQVRDRRIHVVLIDGRDPMAVDAMLIAAPGEQPAVPTTRMVA